MKNSIITYIKKGFLCTVGTLSICIAFTACGGKNEVSDSLQQDEQLPAGNEPENISAPSSQEAAQNNADSETEARETKSEKWSVLDSETAKSVDADFIGSIWKLDEDRFYILESEAYMEDGASVSASPSSDYEPDDSELIPVIYDESTHFYMRTIYENGVRSEDTEAGPADLAQYMSVEMKGHFEKNKFYATEIRLIRVA